MVQHVLTAPAKNGKQTRIKRARINWLHTYSNAALLVALSFLTLATRAAGGTTDPSTFPRVQGSDITYVGAFQIPNTGAEKRIGYGGQALGFNPEHNSLFIGGHDWYQLLCEVSIPTPGRSSDYSLLPSATILQTCADVTEGTLSSVNPGDTNGIKLGGTLVYNKRIITSAYAYYDGGCTQKITHAASGKLDLSVQGDFSGFFPMSGTALPRGKAGYMTVIPQVWREKFGGPALTGMGGLAIVGCASSGPSATVFNPDDVGTANPIPGATVLFYPASSPIASELFDYRTSNSQRGIAFPENRRSVLFIGSQGEKKCYGYGTADASLDGTKDAHGVTYCYDPCNDSKGTHGYPYRVRIWAYDANDLLAAKAGTIGTEAVRPYDVWNLPEFDECGRVTSAAFDPQGSTLYIAPGFGERPIIHVYKINTGPVIVPPKAPTNLSVVTP